MQYTDRDAAVRERKVACGVPQGSVLGPLLWNLAYDHILRSALPPGSTVVCYADDTIVLAGGIDWGEAAAKTNLAGVVCSMAILGLGARKTEAVFFHNGSPAASNLHLSR